jgi:hypothetical protein
MSLSAQTWRALPIQSIASASPTRAELLTSIRNAYVSTSYLNGSARTPGSGVAWTFTEQLDGGSVTAIAGTPVASTLGHKAIFAGGAAVGSAVMGVNQSFSSSTIMSSLSKNAGAFTSWSNANPFTSGNFYGYVAFAEAGGSVDRGPVSVRCYESQDSLAVFMHYQGTNVVVCTILGGIIDPESASAADAEIDGKLYGVMSSGAGVSSGNRYVTTTMHTTVASIFYHNATAFRVHFGVFSPGSGTVKTLGRMASSFAYNGLVSRSGKVAKIPIHIMDSARFVGRMREIWLVRDAVNGNTLRDGATEIGHFVGGGVSSSADAILLSS